MPDDTLPQRIVSLAPSITETIFAIGGEGTLVGVTAQCQYPPKVVDLLRNRQLRSVGSYSRTNLERVTALEPDLVVATRHMQKSTLKKLQEDGLIILVLDYPKTVEGIFEIIQLLGKRLGVEGRASSLVSSLRKRVELVEEKTKPKTPHTVFFEAFDEPLMTVGGRVWINDMIRLAGGANVFADRSEPFPLVQPSEVMACNPDVMVLAVRKQEDVERIYRREGWSEIKALKERRVIGVDATMAGRPTPRAIDLLEKLSESLSY